MDNRSCAASVCKPVNGFPPQSLHGAFEDYRYDALGRRVLVRTRKDSVCEGADCESSMMWVVFDGSAIAAEIRGPGADGLAVDTLEAGAGSGAMYGSVEYLNGPTLDEPLEIQGIQPYRTWRGLIDGGQCLDGTCGNSGVIDYPGLTYEAYLTVRPSGQSAPVSWHGSLFAEGIDDGGLMYRRNRYYDPTTGRFTQEDPLGLGGGMNAYGFGNGDPVNFSDPFGLCVPLPGCLLAAAAAGGGTAVVDGGGTTASVGLGALAGPAVVVSGFLSLWAALPVKPVDNVRRIPGALVQADATAVQNTRVGDLPAKGPPNTSAARDNGKGKGQIRDYGEDGRAETDYDFGHDHTGAGDPHAHDWDWTKTPPRQPPRPIGPDERPPE